MHDDRMASDAGEYWARRREITPSPERAVVADGDRRLALLVDVADETLVERYERLRRRLDDFPCLRTTPPEELHTTVKLFDHADEGASDSTPLDRIDAAVSDVAADLDPFEVRFPRLNLFPDTVYAEVDAGGALSGLNRALCDRAWAATTDRDADRFIPHLTLGYFTGDERYDRLVDFLERHRDLDLPAATVSELSIVAYDVTSNWSSASRTLRTYPL